MNILPGVKMDSDKVKDMVERFFNGRYEFERFLGEGSFARVYLLKQNFLDEKRAMKLIKEPLTQTSNVDKVFREAKLATRLRHENIIGMHGAGIISTYGTDSNGHFILDKKENAPCDDWAYFIMEYVSGGDLKDYHQSFIDSEINMPLMQVLTIIKQILMGLNVLHTARPSIIHRDLKTGNIFVGFDCNGKIQVKIADFGIAREVASDVSVDRFGGTKLYMSPESFKGESSKSSDVYAVGVIFYLLLTNTYPRNITKYTNDQLQSASSWNMQVKRPSYYNNRVDSSTDEVILKSIAINPEDRYKDAGEFLKKVEELIASISRDENPFFDYGVIQATSKFNQYNKLNINENILKAFKLAQKPGKLSDAIEVLEKEMITDYTTRRNYAQILRMWKSEHPDRKLISEAYKITLKAENYKLASTFIREAIAINPSIGDMYESTAKIWDLLSKLERDENLTDAVDALEEYMACDKQIHAEYNDLIDILKTYPTERIADEAIKLAEEDKQLEAAQLMEFVVAKDKKYKTKYAQSIALWKQELD